MNSAVTDDVVVVGKRARDLMSAAERDDEMNHMIGGIERHALHTTAHSDRPPHSPLRDRPDRRAPGRCILCSVMSSLLSIVVPVFNEAGSLEPLYEEMSVALGPLGAFEVVFVDDGSTDGSISVMERLAAGHDACA